MPLPPNILAGLMQSKVKPGLAAVAPAEYLAGAAKSNEYL
jgi:hypothetical protein